MKVRELIACLQLQDPEMKVIARGKGQTHSFEPLEKVRLGQSPVTKNRVVLEGSFR
jgi:hypothetical protein